MVALAKLSMMPRDLRAATAVTRLHEFNSQNQKLRTLYNREKPTAPFEIIEALNGTAFAAKFATSPLNPKEITDKEIAALSCASLLDHLSEEADWIFLMLLCDQCPVTHSATPNALLYKLAQQLLNKKNVPEQTRSYAFYFLRSQHQQDLVPLESDIISIILETQDIDAWTVLLSNENIQSTIMSNHALIQKNFDHLLNVYKAMQENNVDVSLTESLWNSLFAFFPAHENLLDILPNLISWISKSNKENLAKVIAFLFGHPDMAIKKKLIHLALTGAYKLTVLHAALTSFTPEPEDILENPLFNVFLFDKNLTASFDNAEAIIHATLDHLENINTGRSQEENLETTHDLFKLFVRPSLEKHVQYLPFTLQIILTHFPFLCGAFTPLMSRLPDGEATISACCTQAITLISAWDFQTTLNAKIKKEFPQYASCLNEAAKAGMVEDATKNVVRDIIGQLILLFTVPNVWNRAVQVFENKLTENLEKILAHDAKDFFRSVSTLPWDQHTGQRICSEKSIDWLFNLNCMRTLSFIQPDDSQFQIRGKQYLRNLLIFNDAYVIKKLFEINVSPSFLLFKGMVKIDNYKGLEHTLFPLLTHPDFHIEHYYAGASEAFKQQPQVKAAMQLKYFFHPESVQALVGNDPSITDIKKIHHLETFFHELRYRHLDSLHDLSTQLSKIGFTESNISDSTDEILYQKARSLHYQIKKLPEAATIALHDDIRVAIFTIAHRTLKYERVNNPTHLQSTTKVGLKTLFKAAKGKLTQLTHRHLIVGKNVKIPFFRCILKALVETQACRSENNIPFIWHIYVEYIKIKRIEQKVFFVEEDGIYSPGKMTKVNTWLNEQIFRGEKTVETLGALSEALLRDIFAETNVAIDGLIEESKRQLLLPDADSEDGNEIETESPFNAMRDGTDSDEKGTLSLQPSVMFRKSSIEASTPHSKASASEKMAADTAFITEDFWADLRTSKTTAIVSATEAGTAVITSCHNSLLYAAPPSSLVNSTTAYSQLKK